MIWKRKITLEALNAMGEGNMVALLTATLINRVINSPDCGIGFT
ncbi:hypothetical protein ACUODJ_09935, partial [Escherichia sp. HC-CC]